MLCACTAKETAVTDAVPSVEEGEDMKGSELKLLIDDQPIEVTWEDNASVEALKQLAPLTIAMEMYGGFEQVGEIGTSITRNDVQTVTSPGDIVLYAGDNIVVFYGSNSWAYTRLGKMELSEDELRSLLGDHPVTLKLITE